MELLAYLEEKGVLHRVDQRWHWAAESYPADEVSLRTINPENVVVVDTTDTANHKVIAEVDWDSAFTTVHDDAIYMVESQQYHVDKLDLERKKAYVRKVDVDYYTDAMTYTSVRVIDDFDKKMKGSIIVEHGEVQVVPQGGGLQEDQVLHLGERGLRRREPAGEGDAHHELLVHHPLGPARRAPLQPGGDHRRPCRARLLPPPHLGHARHVGHPRHRPGIGDKSGEWFVRKDRNWRTITATPGAEQVRPPRRTPSIRRSSCSTPTRGGSGSRTCSTTATTRSSTRQGSSSATAPAPAAARHASARPWKSAPGPRRRLWQSFL